jgi:hypothetical protein
MADPVSPKLARLSQVMAVLATLGIIVVPAIVAAIFLYPGATEFLMLNISHVGGKLTEAVPIQYRIEALFCEALPVGLTVWALWSLRQLFSNFADGRVFSAEPLRHLNHVATALFLGVLADSVMEVPVTYLLTRHNPAGHREITLSFGSNDVIWLFIAGTVLVIARVMAEARRVADENAAFV